MTRAEIFLYLDQTELTNDWRGVVVYPNRNLEPRDLVRYQELLNPERVTRIYLNEIGNVAEQSLGIQAVNLVIESEDTAMTRATELISQARQQIFNEFQLREFLQLIETILIYKLPNTNREELEAMFSLDDLKQTRYFQDVMAEGERNAKLAAAPRLLALGLTVEQVAGALDLDVEVVRQIAASDIQNDAPTAE